MVNVIIYRIMCPKCVQQPTFLLLLRFASIFCNTFRSIFAITVAILLLHWYHLSLSSIFFSHTLTLQVRNAIGIRCSAITYQMLIIKWTNKRKEKWSFPDEIITFNDSVEVYFVFVVVSVWIAHKPFVRQRKTLYFAFLLFRIEFFMVNKRFNVKQQEEE